MGRQYLVVCDNCGIYEEVERPILDMYENEISGEMDCDIDEDFPDNWIMLTNSEYEEAMFCGMKCVEEFAHKNSKGFSTFLKNLFGRKKKQCKQKMD